MDTTTIILIIAALVVIALGAALYPAYRRNWRRKEAARLKSEVAENFSAAEELEREADRFRATEPARADTLLLQAGSLRSSAETKARRAAELEDDTEERAEGRDARERRNWLMPAALALVVLLAVGLAYYFWPKGPLVAMPSPGVIPPGMIATPPVKTPASLDTVVDELQKNRIEMGTKLDRIDEKLGKPLATTDPPGAKPREVIVKQPATEPIPTTVTNKVDVHVRNPKDDPVNVDFDRCKVCEIPKKSRTSVAPTPKREAKAPDPAPTAPSPPRAESPRKQEPITQVDKDPIPWPPVKMPVVLSGEPSLQDLARRQ